MSQAKLPAEARGEWIWCSPPDFSGLGEVAGEPVESYVFLRKEFALDEIPTTAEFWVGGNTHFHVYINGRHFCRGPAPAPPGHVCIKFYDAAYCLQYGRNLLAVLGHNTAISRVGNCRKRGGVWCQLNVDGKPVLWTDGTWLARSGSLGCFLPNQPRVANTDGFVESVDLREYPHGWQEIEYEAKDGWVEATPQPGGVTQKGRCKLTSSPDVSDQISENYTFLNLVIYGRAALTRAVTHVAYPTAPQAPGVYAAEMFIHSAESFADLKFQLITDDPYYLFVNRKLVHVQGKRPMNNWIDPAWNTPRCYAQEAAEANFNVEFNGSAPLKKGHNRVTLVQQVERNSAGATLIFPEIEAAAFKFTRAKDAVSMPGWTVFGPLKLPFSRVRTPLNLEDKPHEFFYGPDPNDAAAHLMAYTFTVEEQQDEGIPIDDVDIEQGQYMVLGLERYIRGCPELEMSGTAGDVLDLVYGDYLDGPRVQPLKNGNRKIYTVILNDDPCTWHAIAPHGMKYLMVFCRKAADKVRLNRISVRKQTINFRDPASFACSDELMNQIWEGGMNTLEATYDSIFLDAGGQREYQFLADAMIQSFASFFLFGGYDFSEKALREFVAAQYETGELPAVVPCDYSVRLLDSMLLWPVWVQRHIQHSGDMELLEELLTPLRRLLIFFEGEACEGDVLLGNRAPLENPCLIDYVDNIDRKGISTGLNALYCHCLLKSEWLFNLADKKDFAKYCNRLAVQIAKAIRNLTWDEDKGLFADAWYDGKMSSAYSMQTNVLALQSGIAHESQYERIFHNLFIEYAPFQKIEIDQKNDNPYFKYFLLDMAFSMGNRDWATDYMRYYWGKMIEKGAATWWEKFSPDIEFDAAMSPSLCHGYGVSANFFLISEVLGIRPAGVGYDQIYFNPNLAAMEWATASVPTPKGSIKVDWHFRETGELEVTLEATYPLEVVAQLDPSVASKTILKVGENVSVLK